MNDTEARRYALNPSHSFIVEAPAGSGKTEILTQRYLVLLSQAKAPEEIVAITFTRKASAEMRARILEALEFSQTPEPVKNHYRHTTWSLAKQVLEQDKKLQWHITSNPNRLRILTIDSLSAFLCRRTPMLSRLGGAPSIAENAETLYQEAALRLITDIFPSDALQPDAEFLLLHLDNRVDKLQSLFAELLNHRDQWLPHILHCKHHSADLKNQLENTLKTIALEKIQLAINAVPSELKQPIVLLAQFAGTELKKIESDNLIAHCEQFTANTTELSAWKGLSSLLLTQTGSLRKTATKQIGFFNDSEEKELLLSTLLQLLNYPEFQKCLRDIQELPPLFFSEMQWTALSAMTRILPLLAAQLHVIFQERNQVDFTEINLGALKSLGDDDKPTDLALYLDYQIQHLLVDEFQDTSILHFHLLEKLIAGWEKNDGRTLFLVGDPMQSIYRFRNAEVGLFLRTKQQGIGNILVTPLTLTMNFRSEPNLVAWFNDTFQTIFPAVSDIATGAVPYTKATSPLPENQSPHVIFSTAFQLADEHKQLIQHIQQLQIKNAEESIAILVRTRAHMTELLSALRLAKISFQCVEIECLADEMVIRDLLALTRALLHRDDRIAWLSIFRAPWCGITLTDLEKIALLSQESTLWQVILNIESCDVSLDAKERVFRFRKPIFDALQAQSLLPFSEILKKVWLSIQGPATVTDKIELDYAESFFALIETHEKQSLFIDADQLETQCKKLYSNPKTDQSIALQIMTIHKSKGLEFDHVILPSLQQRPTGDKEKLFRWLERANTFGGDDLLLAPIKSATTEDDPLYHYLKILETEKQSCEITRLLYVGATRARKSIFFSATIEYNENKNEFKKPFKDSFLEKLWPIYQSNISMDESTRFSAASENIPITLQRFSKKMPNIHFYPFEKNTDEKSVVISLSPPDSFSKIIGTVIHERLQTYPAPWGDAQYHSRLLSLKLLPQQLPDAMQKIYKMILNIEKDSRATWIFSNHQEIKTEWSLTYRDEKQCKTIVIDRTFIDENDVRWIIDYKTSVPHENESLPQFLQREKENYCEQLENYANVLSQLDDREIRLGLYFPLCSAWVEWEYRSLTFAAP
ncbi:MAG: ATP-dependent nuclease subunit A [uncultured bacterium]|nr:MAG: ATP-dependent nuclease subunit A [uncultured bacterium]OGT26571.1 MAG: hypothetical protein A3B71_02805 [Gammaproteobacteria bacterium RIFCSPHIGHO2_02_FULL_42_43]OGT51998.1 MAG: hypothetical protein A3E54_04310 [Gammaproteobacteria bacterium RIFCSPHIGHO2_12_FULL_41_25]OGT61103.1 MAG: hypothetical protein A3I77_06970 [Gammaproteobacteria bacterium RIFCSPLOWO2_02_FULL_42_14]OGT87031.1 MAG: hypothetical protein A3G86_00690 [Gammaproteobacteria bacterium RIFCSPLOWO2_12_FULL_42_18]